MQLKILNKNNILDKTDLIIFFNPGGWGTVSPQKETYARSLLEGVQRTFRAWQLKTVIINYPRTRSGILGKIESLKEIISSFPSESKKLADLIQDLTAKFQNVKIVLIGYSFGGAFVNETIKKIKNNNRVYVIEAGTPFFYKVLDSENILFLDNDGKDALAKRNLKKLTLATVLGFYRLIFYFNLIRLKIAESFHVKGHEYFWENPNIKSQVMSFIKNKIIQKNYAD